MVPNVPPREASDRLIIFQVYTKIFIFYSFFKCILKFSFKKMCIIWTFQEITFRCDITNEKECRQFQKIFPRLAHAECHEGGRCRARENCVGIICFDWVIEFISFVDWSDVIWLWFCYPEGIHVTSPSSRRKRCRPISAHFRLYLCVLLLFSSIPDRREIVAWSPPGVKATLDNASFEFDCHFRGSSLPYSTVTELLALLS